MSDKEIILSPEGKRTLEQELNYLKTVRRREIAERIKAAREFGDLAENAEYDNAKNEQGFVEARILSLENILRHARVASNDGAGEVVSLGATVKVEDLASGNIYDFTIVGSHEADPAKKKISNESPVGKALLGQKVGDVVQVNVPMGLVKYKIISINS
ncbi:MAG TPA: transcription elongation factor GreA [Firmicutes bacterium]|nr:transcription elongation factor GreA [Candidatus Fermentithermobacillaceae bacterium]